MQIHTGSVRDGCQRPSFVPPFTTIPLPTTPYCFKAVTSNKRKDLPEGPAECRGHVPQSGVKVGHSQGIPGGGGRGGGQLRDVRRSAPEAPGGESFAADHCRASRLSPNSPACRGGQRPWKLLDQGDRQRGRRTGRAPFPSASSGQARFPPPGFPGQGRSDGPGRHPHPQPTSVKGEGVRPGRESPLLNLLPRREDREGEKGSAAGPRARRRSALRFR